MLPQQEQHQQEQQQLQRHQQGSLPSQRIQQTSTHQDAEQDNAAAAAHSDAGMAATAAHAAPEAAPLVGDAEAQQLGSSGSGEYADADADEDEYEEEDEDGSEAGSQGSLPLMQQAWKPDYTFKVRCGPHTLAAHAAHPASCKPARWVAVCVAAGHACPEPVLMPNSPTAAMSLPCHSKHLCRSAPYTQQSACRRTPPLTALLPWLPRHCARTALLGPARCCWWATAAWARPAWLCALSLTSLRTTCPPQWVSWGAAGQALQRHAVYGPACSNGSAAPSLGL